MLPQANRLRRSADFQWVMRRGRRAASPVLVVHAAPSSADSPAQVGFVVSKAVGNAVTRNRVKRRLRHALLPLMEGLEGVLIVIRANPATASATWATLVADLERCLARVHSGGR